MSKKPNLQHQVYPPPIITAEEYECRLMADRQTREEYKRQRADYFEGIRRAGYLLAVDRRDELISNWEREQMEDG